MDDAEFQQLLKKEEGQLMRVAWAVLGNEADAWDALQEAALQAWRSRRKLRGGTTAFPHWIRRILVRKCLDLARKHKGEVSVDPVELPNLPHSPVQWDQGSDTLGVWQALSRLPFEQRQVVTLHFLGDLTARQIAKQLQLPVGTVKSRLHRGKQNLKSALTEKAPDEVICGG